MSRLCGLWRACWLAGLAALVGCGAPSRTALEILTPGAAACRVASQINPAQSGSGLGGTGAPVVRGPDPGGIGGTGQVATGSGLGGTGAPMVAQDPGNGLGGTGSPLAGGDSGLGGTGIVGVVTGFASICVNGVEVDYSPSMPVDRDGVAAPVSELAVGQLVALQAVGQGDQLRARRIAVIDAAVGPLTAVDARTGRFDVMQQAALALAREDLQGLAVGDWVRVSGQRVASGDIRASRVQRVATTEAYATGPYGSSGTVGLRVGATPVTASALPAGLREGQEVGVRGEWVDGRLRARELQLQPTRAAMGGASEVLLQGYVHAVRGRELQLGYQSLTLGDRLQVDGGELGALRVDQPVQVRGRVGADQRVTVERIELRGEGRRGVQARSTAPATASTDVPTGSSSSGTTNSSGVPLVTDDGGRGRGGRGSSNSGSGSSNSGSGGDSGGRGRGRGGDSGSSGSGSSGSGSSGSGSSGSGSSGSGSSGSGSSGSGSSGSGSSGSGSSGSGTSGSGDSGGDSSGRGRGRNRGSS